jgi:hypothetical protein
VAQQRSADLTDSYQPQSKQTTNQHPNYLLILFVDEGTIVVQLYLS